MIKQMMIRGMDAVMLNCEEATYLITKSELTKVGCVKRMQMKMHLMGCELCRRFKLQSDFINENLEQLEKINQTYIHHQLPEIKKEELQSLVETDLSK
jgi:hypothetical protein